jgi:four helix bundle protein
VGGVRRFTDLRAWQACRAFKQSIYRICIDSPLATDWSLRKQLEQSAAAPSAHLAEGFGRFNPADFARFAVMARASLLEAQNHLIDAADKRHITDDVAKEVSTMAEAALQEVTGLIEYLQSPEALRNARKARERRIASRPDRRAVKPDR